MSFFNNKEEVLNIELTPYGRKKLFEGTFKPTYYSFHDEGIIYDLTNAQTSDEIQYSSSIRLLEESILLKPQRKYDLNNTTINDSYSLNNLIGNSSLNSDYAPAWSVSVIKGKIESFQEKYKTQNGSSPVFYNIDIPQINFTDLKNNIIYLDSRTEKVFGDLVFEDQTGWRIQTAYLMLDVSEINTDIDSDVFDIELFEVISGSSGEELKQIFFKKPQQNVINNILLDESEIPQQILNENLEYADTYFNLLVDQEIDLEQISNEVGAQLVRKIPKAPFGENC